MSRFIETIILTGVLFCCLEAAAGDSQERAVLSPGQVRAVAAGGLVNLNRHLTYGIEASFEVGVARGLELAGPLALGIRLVDGKELGSLYVAAGVVDFCITPKGHLLYSPAVALAGVARLGPESALGAALDFTGAEEDLGSGDHPIWARGSAALSIDMGPWLTVAAGVAYQREIFGGDQPAGLRESGWVGDSRVSIGSVRAHPFSDLPFLSVHVTRLLDIVGLARFDINTDDDTTDARWLLGLKLLSQSPEHLD